jgi:membrane protein DedA with SNARE-associated domain
VLATIVDVAHVGLPVMFLLIAAESTGVPLPGETALIAASLLAAHGQFPIEAVIALAATAAILGDNFGYLIGRKAGRRMLRHPRLARWGERVLARGQPFFERHGAKAVFFGRWIAVLRIGAAWLAGVNGMRWPSFLLWNALGGVCWATSVGLLAYTLGEGAERAIRAAGLIGAAGVVVFGAGALLVLRARHKSGEPAGE